MGKEKKGRTRGQGGAVVSAAVWQKHCRAALLAAAGQESKPKALRNEVVKLVLASGDLKVAANKAAVKAAWPEDAATLASLLGGDFAVADTLVSLQAAAGSKRKRKKDRPKGKGGGGGGGGAGDGGAGGTGGGGAHAQEPPPTAATAATAAAVTAAAGGVAAQKKRRVVVPPLERETVDLFVAAETLQCAHRGCVPCIYKLVLQVRHMAHSCNPYGQSLLHLQADTCSVALQWDKTKPGAAPLRPNTRPELCIR